MTLDAVVRAWLARDAVAQEEARVGAGQLLDAQRRDARGERRGRSGRQRVRAIAAAVPVGGEDVGVSVADEPHRSLARLGTVEAEQRADVDLQQRARAELGSEQLAAAGEEAFGALGVGDEEAEARVADVPAGGQPVRVDARERDLEQDPARAPGAVGDQVELVRREGCRPERMDLAAGMQEQRRAQSTRSLAR